MKITIESTSLLFTAFAFSLVSVATAHASPGDLDPSWGNRGRADVGTPQQSFVHGIEQSDGKLLFGGSVQVNAKRADAVVTRVHASGAPDLQFGKNGFFVFPADGEKVSTVRALVQQSDGKILVGLSTSGKAVVLRLEANGTLDSKFGQKGVVKLPVAPKGYASVTSLAVTPDARIIAAGTETLVRLKNDGAIEKDLLTLLLSDFDRYYFKAAYVQALSDGSALVTGTYHHPKFLQRAGFIAKILPNDELDPSYAKKGTQDFTFDICFPQFGPAVVHNNQSMTIPLACARPTPNPNHLLKIASSGVIDPSFGWKGSVPIHQLMRGNSQYGDQVFLPATLAAQSDGKLLFTSTRRENIGIARLLPSGRLDPSFGINGMAVVRDVAETDMSAFIMVLRDGAILRASMQTRATGAQFSLMRFLP